MLRRLAPITVLSPCMAAWFEHNRLTAVFTSKDLAMGKLPELRAYNGSVSHVSLYSYSLGKINSNFSLQDQPYGPEFTRAVHGIARRWPRHHLRRPARGVPTGSMPRRGPEFSSTRQSNGTIAVTRWTWKFRRAPRRRRNRRFSTTSRTVCTPSTRRCNSTLKP